VLLSSCRLITRRHTLRQMRNCRSHRLMQESVCQAAILPVACLKRHLTVGASAAAGLRSVTTHQPERYKDENRQLEDARLGGRLHALVMPPSTSPAQPPAHSDLASHGSFDRQPSALKPAPVLPDLGLPLTSARADTPAQQRTARPPSQQPPSAQDHASAAHLRRS
jgi:hypothetical protein